MLLRHHEPNLGHRPRRAGASAWTREEALRWDARRAAETGSLFAVLQGKVVPEALAAALAEPLRREISP
jgi:hypothetical protein